jgi:hypothetical protein
MSLSPFVSFQSRFVTYLLDFPRTPRGLKVLTREHLVIVLESQLKGCVYSVKFWLHR